jgi:hypothetical protein
VTLQTMYKCSAQDNCRHIQIVFLLCNSCR